MTAPDQTNAEVSDERLREVELCPFCGEALTKVESLAKSFVPARLFHEFRHPRNDCILASRFLLWSGPASQTPQFLAEWNRRSVTSQASEGEVVTAHLTQPQYDAVSEALDFRLAGEMEDDLNRAVYERASEKIAEMGRKILYASPSKRVERLETGWLIEINRHSTGPTWFSMGGTEDDGGHFTKDSLKALRFGRKEDAQAYVDDIGWTECVPTEHEWVDGRQALQGGRS